MPIVIMKTDTHPLYADWRRPHAVWDGDYKSAVEWCEKKNVNARNKVTVYDPVKVKKEDGKNAHRD